VAPDANVPTAELMSLTLQPGTSTGVIEIELEAGRIRVRGAVDEAALRSVLEVLVKR
jgi:hypothetical protein